MKAPGGAILISLSLEGEGQACHEPELSEWFMGEGGYTSSETDPVLKAAYKSVRPDAYEVC